VKYHSSKFVLLTREQAREQRLVGSLTGAVASQKVTEARNGSLRVDGNHPLSALA
jgi:FKBP-type peptidyl-prolyl cis-trans isomerase 2